MSKPHWRWLTHLKFERREEVPPELLPDALTLIENLLRSDACPATASPNDVFLKCIKCEETGIWLLKRFWTTFQTFKATKIKSHGLRARQKIVPTIIGSAVVGGIIAATEFGPILVGWPIKGNISKNTGQRIYHTPGQEFYTQTRIDWLSGERWFCSEADARAAGWRKSRS